MKFKEASGYELFVPKDKKNELDKCIKQYGFVIEDYVAGEEKVYLPLYGASQSELQAIIFPPNQVAMKDKYRFHILNYDILESGLVKNKLDNLIKEIKKLVNRNIS